MGSKTRHLAPTVKVKKEIVQCREPSASQSSESFDSFNFSHQPTSTPSELAKRKRPKMEPPRDDDEVSFPTRFPSTKRKRTSVPPEEPSLQQTSPIAEIASSLDLHLSQVPSEEIDTATIEANLRKILFSNLQKKPIPMKAVDQTPDNSPRLHIAEDPEEVEVIEGADSQFPSAIGRKTSSNPNLEPVDSNWRSTSWRPKVLSETTAESDRGGGRSKKRIKKSKRAEMADSMTWAPRRRYLEGTNAGRPPGFNAHSSKSRSSPIPEPYRTSPEPRTTEPVLPRPLPTKDDSPKLLEPIGESDFFVSPEVRAPPYPETQQVQERSENLLSRLTVDNLAEVFVISQRKIEARLTQRMETMLKNHRKSVLTDNRREIAKLKDVVAKNQKDVMTILLHIMKRVEKISSQMDTLVEALQPVGDDESFGSSSQTSRTSATGCSSENYNDNQCRWKELKNAQNDLVFANRKSSINDEQGQGYREQNASSVTRVENESTPEDVNAIPKRRESRIKPITWP